MYQQGDGQQNCTDEIEVLIERGVKIRLFGLQQKVGIDNEKHPDKPDDLIDIHSDWFHHKYFLSSHLKISRTLITSVPIL